MCTMCIASTLQITFKVWMLQKGICFCKRPKVPFKNCRALPHTLHIIYIIHPLCVTLKFLFYLCAVILLCDRFIVKSRKLSCRPKDIEDIFQLFDILKAFCDTIVCLWNHAYFNIFMGIFQFMHAVCQAFDMNRCLLFVSCWVSLHVFDRNWAVYIIPHSKTKSDEVKQTPICAIETIIEYDPIIEISTISDFICILLRCS